MIAPAHIILSRTDSIGDVMLTLPMAGMLRDRFPGLRITFLGRRYTAPVIRHCRHVDEVITFESLSEGGSAHAEKMLRGLGADALVHVFPQRDVARWAHRAGIATRVGTAHRWWHWSRCNHRIAFSRRKSGLHEAQLNIKLLEPFGIRNIPTPDELAKLGGFAASAPDPMVQALLRPDRRHVLLHPLSKGSAVEWGLDHFATLIRLLDPARFQVIVTGTLDEALRYRAGLPLQLPHVTDAGGTLTLDQLIALIGACDSLVSASTGPLHIAAACGRRAIGLYSPKRPIHPGRWAPIGTDVHALVADGVAPEGDPMAHIRAISPEHVLRLLEELP